MLNGQLLSNEDDAKQLGAAQTCFIFTSHINNAIVEPLERKSENIKLSIVRLFLVFQICNALTCTSFMLLF